MQNRLKYQLLPEGSDYSAGCTNFGDCINRPLDVGGCTIFVCEKGKADVTLNFKPYSIKAGHILILFGDTVIVPKKTSEDFWIFTVSISTNIVDELLYNSSSDFFDFLYANPVLTTSREQRYLLAGWERQIMWMLRPENSANAYSLISNTLRNFFIVTENTINSAHKLTGIRYKMSRGWILINKFTKLLYEHGHENRNVNYYADQLCVTPGYLYKVVTKEMGTTPKDLIENYITSEIKVYLATTDLSVKEIAEELHFEDPSYMCRFFRRRAGVSLTEYKEAK